MRSTVTLAVSFFPLTFAVIVAVPAALAVTLPLLDTDATQLVLLDQFALLDVPYTLRVL